MSERPFASVLSPLVPSLPFPRRLCVLTAQLEGGGLPWTPESQKGAGVTQSRQGSCSVDGARARPSLLHTPMQHPSCPQAGPGLLKAPGQALPTSGHENGTALPSHGYTVWHRPKSQRAVAAASALPASGAPSMMPLTDRCPPEQEHRPWVVWGSLPLRQVCGRVLIPSAAPSQKALAAEPPRPGTGGGRGRVAWHLLWDHLHSSFGLKAKNTVAVVAERPGRGRLPASSTSPAPALRSSGSPRAGLLPPELPLEPPLPWRLPQHPSSGLRAHLAPPSTPALSTGPQNGF